jgi:hypothetical protein
MMPRGITRRIGFRFHDAPADAPAGEIVNDNLANQETR